MFLCIWGKKKPINIKNFGGTPPGVRPVCPGDTSHLSRDMSRLSRGHSVPLVHINQAQMSQVSLGRPEFVPGTPPGHPTAKFLCVIFLYRFFSLQMYVMFSRDRVCTMYTSVFLSCHCLDLSLATCVHDTPYIHELVQRQVSDSISLGSLWPFRGAIQPECEKKFEKSLEMGSRDLPATGVKKSESSKRVKWGEAKVPPFLGVPPFL